MSRAVRRSTLYAATAGALLLTTTPAAAAPRTYVIVVDKMKFGSVPVAAKGDTIVWVNRDILRHSVTAKSKRFDIDLPPGAKVRQKLTSGGSFAFFCKYHPGMQGQLTIK